MHTLRSCLGPAFAWCKRSLPLFASLCLLAFSAPAEANFAHNYGGLTGAGNTITEALATDASGNLYVALEFNAPTLTIGSVTLTRLGTTDVAVAKLDPGGNVLWAVSFGGASAFMTAKSLAIDGSGNVYLGGIFQNANLTTPALTKLGNQDGFAIKLDSSGALAWARNFGGASAAATAASIGVDGIGNVYVAGSIQSANLTTPALTRFGIVDAFAIKLDSSGATTWAKNFGGSGAITSASSLAVDGAGNLYLGGNFGSANLTTPPVTKIGGTDALAMKLDSAGTVTWARNFGGSLSFAGTTSLALDAAANVHLGGTFSNASLTTPALTKIGNSDAFAIKLDSAGSTTWARNYGGTSANVTAPSLAVDSTGNVHLAGVFQNANLTTPALTKLGNSDIFTLKLDSAGTTTWATSFGGSGSNANFMSIAVDGASSVYVGGSYSGGNLTSPPLLRMGGNDALLVKLDASGATTSARNFVSMTGANTLVSAVAVDAAGNSYVAGQLDAVSATFGTVTLSRIGSTDAFVAKLDNSGTVLWARSFGGPSASAQGLSLAVDSAGNVHVGGLFSSANLTSPAVTRIGLGDAFVITLDSTGSLVRVRNFGGAGAQANARALAVDGAGNLYVAGDFSSASLTTPALAKIGTTDAYVIKLDSNGSSVWAQNFGGAGATANALALTVGGGGNVYVGGILGGSNLTTPALTRFGNNDALVIKLDSAGATTWAKNFGGAGVFASAVGLAVDGAGNLHLAGGFQGGNLTSPSLSAIGTADGLVIKLDSAGNIVWARNHGGLGANASWRALQVDGSGNLFLGGFVASGNLTTPALTRIGNGDAIFGKLDSAGTTSWIQGFGGAGASAFALGLALDASGSVYLGGQFVSANLTTPSLARIGNSDALILNITAPGAPSIGTASAGNTSATVTFTAPTGDGGSAISGYTATCGAQSAGGSTSPITVTGLANGTPVTCSVAAINAIGIGPASAASNSVTPAGLPDAPIIGTAVRGDGSVSVVFTPGSDNGSAITSFTATCGTQSAGGTVSPIVVSGLSNGTPVMCTVTATNGVGQSSPSSASNSVTPAGVPAAPTIGTATRGDGSVSITFTAGADNGSAITGFTATCGAQSAGGTGSPIVVSGLTNGTPVTCTVTATNGAGQGAPSSASNVVTPAGVPAAPTIGAATRGDGSVSVTFTPGSANGSPITGFTATCGIQSASGSGSPIVVSGLANGTPVMCTVIATNGVGSSAASAASNSVTPAAVPAVPTIGTATRGNGSVSVAFTGGADNGSPITAFTATCGTQSNGGTSSPIVVSGLTNGTPVSCTVTATNNVGTSLSSGSSNSVTPATTPAAPSIGTATAGNTSALVTFIAPSDDGGSAITGYTATCGAQSAGGAASPIRVTGLANGTPVTCSVVATNDVGTSAGSGISNSVTPAVQLVAVAARLFDATDTPVTGTRQLEFSIYANAVPTGGESPLWVTTRTMTVTDGFLDLDLGDPTLAPSPDPVFPTDLFDHPAYLQLRVDGSVPLLPRRQVSPSQLLAGVSSAMESYTLVYGQIPDAPLIGTATGGIGQATVSFTAPGGDGGWPITGYSATCGPQMASGATSPITVSGLPNASVSCTVAAINRVGTGPSSAASNSVTPVTAPDAPNLTSVTRGDGSVLVAFTAGAGNGSAITGFTATCGAQSTGGTSSPILVTGLSNGTAVTCSVTATNGVGTSAPSADSVSVTPATIPGAPAIGIATPGNASASVSFTAPSSDGGESITLYIATCTPGTFTKSGAGSPLVVTGLQNGTTYTCSVTATNAVGTGPASGPVTVTPALTPLITSTNAASFTVNSAGTFTVTATGDPAPALSVSGSLPSGVTFTPATGLLAGTPALGTVGSYPLTVTASNGNPPNATQSFTLTVAKASQSIGFTNPSTRTLGAPFGLTVSANSGLVVTVTSATPSVCTVSGTNLTMVTAGTCTLNANQAGDANYNAAATATVSFQINGAAPVITSAGNASFTVNAAGSFTVQATGTPAPTLSVTGPLPGGVTFVAGSGVLSGTPASGTVGTYPLTFTAANGVSPDATQSFTLTVAKASQAITFANPGAMVQRATPVSLSAISSSGLAVTFTSTTASVCTVSGASLTLVTAGTCTINANQAGDANYNAAPQVQQSFTVTAPARLSNISTRMQVLTGNDVMIAGFIVGGTTSKTVVVNVAGPHLANFGITNALANPTLTIVRSSDNTVIASNDDWQTQAVPADVAAIQASGFQPNSAQEPAVILTLPPGAYTAIVQGVGGTTGVGLVGVFEVDHPEVPLANISTRGQVLTGNDVMIAGFIVGGTTSKTVVVNVAGPHLANFGITNALANPTLTVMRSSDNTVIASNDDWQTQANPADVAAITATGFQPNNALEPALILTLPPGAYTAIVQGAGGVTGVGLVGVFAVP